MGEKGDLLFALNEWHAKRQIPLHKVPINKQKWRLNARHAKGQIGCFQALLETLLVQAISGFVGHSSYIIM